MHLKVISPEVSGAMRVLIVEDEVDLADAIARGFRREGMAVDVAYDGIDGYDKACSTHYDVIVLDRDLPGMSGDELCRRITARDPLTRVIMLTASGTVDDRIEGLSIGADDYLPKPFNFGELTARVRTLYRRAVPATGTVLTCGDVELDTGKRTVVRAGRSINLTRIELGILEVLMMARGDVVSSEELLARVWNSKPHADTGTVRVTIMHLRQKLGTPRIVHTKIGLGYWVGVAGA